MSSKIPRVKSVELKYAQMLTEQETTKGYDELVNLLPDDWYEVLMDECKKDYFVALSQYITRARAEGHDIYPKHEDTFNALHLTPFKNVRAVIIAQDPYINPGQAHGLALSVPSNVPFPPSLRNVLREYSEQLGKEIPKSGDLSNWAREGVLLLNSYLTVEKGKSLSHSSIGWSQLTDKIIQKVNDEHENVLFLLWGSFAQGKEGFIDLKKHRILKSAHPSPLSAHRGFFGTNHFIELRKHLLECSS